MIDEIILLSILLICILLNIIHKEKLPDKVGVAFGFNLKPTGTMKRETWVYIFYPLTCIFTYIFPFFYEKNYYVRLIALMFVGSSLGLGVYLLNTGKKLTGIFIILLLLVFFMVLLFV